MLKPGITFREPKGKIKFISDDKIAAQNSMMLPNVGE